MKSLKGVSSDRLSDEYYLVARGVRACAAVGYCEEKDRAKVLARLEKVRASSIRHEKTLISPISFQAIPFAIKDNRGIYHCGYAADVWVVELLSWLITDSSIPKDRKSAIHGMLLGYSAQAIGMFQPIVKRML